MIRLIIIRMWSVLTMSTTIGKDIRVVSMDAEAIAVIKKNRKNNHTKGCVKVMEELSWYILLYYLIRWQITFSIWQLKPVNAISISIWIEYLAFLACRKWWTEGIILLMIQRYLFWKQLNQFGGIEWKHISIGHSER